MSGGESARASAPDDHHRDVIELGGGRDVGDECVLHV
jgi:hypothetical protein